MNTYGIVALIFAIIGWILVGLMVAKFLNLKDAPVEGILNISEDNEGNCKADVVILIPVDDLLDMRKKRINFEVTHKSS